MKVSDDCRVAGVQLNRLGCDEGRIFDVYRQTDGSFHLLEGCDEYFRITMTAAELAELGRELIAASEAKR